MDNKTLNTSVLASDAPGSVTAFNNRGVDFTNRAADINPEDIETHGGAQGPGSRGALRHRRGERRDRHHDEARQGRQRLASSTATASASSSTSAQPEVQRVYGPTSVAGDAIGSFQYFGAPYAAGHARSTTTSTASSRQALTQKHNLSFSGAAADNRVNYRIGCGGQPSAGRRARYGVQPRQPHRRASGATGDELAECRPVDAATHRPTTTQPFKGDNGPLIGLLLWPQTDNASDYLTPAGTRRRITIARDERRGRQPVLQRDKNQINSKNNRLIANVGLVVTPFSWGFLKTNIGADTYTNQNLDSPPSGERLRHHEQRHPRRRQRHHAQPQRADVLQRQPDQHHREPCRSAAWSATRSHDVASTTNALKGQDFLDPNFVSVNNTNLRQNRTTIAAAPPASARSAARRSTTTITCS